MRRSRRRPAAARTAVRPSRRYHHGNLRQALLDAARDLVEREGAEALTLRAAARRAGVSQAAPYRHFADKRALLAGVAEEGFRALADGMRRAAAAHAADPLGRLQALGLAYVGFATGHPSHFRVMFGRELADRSPYPSLEEAAAEAFGLLVDGVAECQRAGHVRAGEPRDLALAAWSAIHGLSALVVDGQLLRLEAREAYELAQSVTTALFLGLAAAPDARQA